MGKTNLSRDHCAESQTLAVTYYARHLSLAFMKRRSGASTRTTRLISQQSPADPAVTLFKLENPDSNPEPVPPASAARRSKRIKLEVVGARVKAYGDGCDEELPTLAAKPLAGKGKGKKAARPPAQPPSSASASASPQKPKAIKQALEKPHPAPARWRETYDAIREMRTRFPAPVDTMGCDTAKWKETDPRVRHAL